MQVEPLSIEGAWSVRPRILGDERGAFLEWFKDSVFGRRWDTAWTWCRPTARSPPGAS